MLLITYTSHGNELIQYLSGSKELVQQQAWNREIVSTGKRKTFAILIIVKAA